MATFTRDDTTIHYEEYGAGFPVLLIAPGGMRSAIGAWANAPWHPVEQLAPRYRVIAMDQRNAGASVGPITASDGWGTYTADQLALLDHLGVRRCHVLGMCIGGSYIVNLLRTAPERFVAAVVLQPIGLDGNRGAFHEMFDAWAADLADARPEIDPATWVGFRDGMYGGDEPLFSVPTAQLAEIATPLLVLMGDDRFHPQSASRLLAGTAPNARLVQRWKDPADRPAARAAVEEFLAAHTPT
ncbi:MAG TPA: alpha/beta hydrolase [Pseudonocardia sp.]|jgi:pimeloyl-ACP methyl ester carboxylesterase|nr:alpha/beta hydrolase [Pseudonocardia sp.]